MRATLWLSALLFGSLAAAPLKAQPIRNCEDYTATAMAQFFQMQQSGCNLAGPEWHDNYDDHMNWCRGVGNADLWQAEVDKRARALAQCGSGALAEECRAYADKAVTMYRLTGDYDCGFDSPRWHGDFGAHFNWCINVSPEQRLSEDRARLHEAHACRPSAFYCPECEGEQAQQPPEPSPGPAVPLPGGDVLGPIDQFDPNATALATIDFRDPTFNGFAVDICLNWGTNCGQPAADAFCQSQGYAGSVGHAIQEDAPPTLVIGDGVVCEEGFCDRFSAITCSR